VRGSCQGYKEAGWQAHSTDRLRDLEEDEEELLPEPSTILLAFFTISGCGCITFPAREGCN